MASFRSDRRLYTTADRDRVVEEGDPDAAFLLVAEGRALEPAQIRKYDLELGDDGRVVLPEQKMQAKPEDKMAAAPENKGAVDDVDATDAARDLADDNDLDLEDVEGSGKDGRILVSDVEAALE